MQFLNPQLLWLLLLGLIPVALYLFRRKSRTVSVSTLVFFKTLAREHQESAWLRRLKKWLSFVLTLLILCLVVFVLARLIAKQDDPDQYRTVVILLDRSASMEAEWSEGATLLDRGRELLRERLEKVPEEVGTVLIAYDARPEVLQPRTFTRRELIAQLDSVEVRPIADDREEALETAELIARLEEPAVIWHISDQPITGAGAAGGAGSGGAPEPGEGEIRIQELTLASPDALNVGITAFRVRPVPLEYSRYEVFLQLTLNEAAPEPVISRLEVSVGGIPNQFREVDIDPGDRVGMTFPLTGSSDQILHLRLETEGDSFPADDELKLPLPSQQPVLAAWIRPDDREDPYTRFALSSIQESGRFELLKGSPEAWPLSEEVDAVIFDGWLPEEWPTEIPAVVINPPGQAGPILARALDQPIPYDSVRVGNDQHPVLFRVSSSRISLTQTSVFQSSGSLEPLWIAGREPVLSAGEAAGQRLVVMGFSPGLSERLPLTASFPLLMGNALLWAVNREGESSETPVYPSGTLAEIDGEDIEWTTFSQGEWRTETVPVSGGVVEMDRLGVWNTGSGDTGVSYLLSAGESNLPAASESAISDYFMEVEGPGGSLKWWILGILIFLLLLESLLFHRFAVY